MNYLYIRWQFHILFLLFHNKLRPCYFVRHLGRYNLKIITCQSLQKQDCNPENRKLGSSYGNTGRVRETILKSLQNREVKISGGGNSAKGEEQLKAPGI